MATNIELAAKKNTRQVKFENGIDDFEYVFNENKKDSVNTTKTFSKQDAKTIMEGYAIYGDALFSDEEAAKKVMDEVYENGNVSNDITTGTVKDTPLEVMQKNKEKILE
jgi:hypothetical protein